MTVLGWHDIIIKYILQTVHSLYSSPPLGQVVYATYVENQWVYATTESGQQGFVPLTYLTAFDVQQVSDATSHWKQHRTKQKKKPQNSKRSIANILGNERKAESGVTKLSTDHNCSVVANHVHDKLELERSLSFGEMELGDHDIFGYISDTSFHRSESDQSLDGSQYSALAEEFVRKPAGKYLVLHSFHAEDENDATILKGTVNNIDIL